MYSYKSQQDHSLAGFHFEQVIWHLDLGSHICKLEVMQYLLGLLWCSSEFCKTFQMLPGA